jgi:hypothetical protein
LDAAVAMTKPLVVSDRQNRREPLGVDWYFRGFTKIDRRTYLWGSDSRVTTFLALAVLLPDSLLYAARPVAASISRVRCQV